MFVLDTAADRAALAAAAVVESGARVMMFWRLLLLQLVAARVACRKEWGRLKKTCFGHH